MKKIIITCSIILLTILSSPTFAVGENETSLNAGENESKAFTQEEILENIKNESDRVGEKVTTPKGGSMNISFSDGYNGYCINKGWNAAKGGDSFIVKDTSMATNSINHKDVSNYLKILFVDYHDFAVSDAKETAKIVWNFTDRQYWNSPNEIIQGILSIAESGRTIADHGEVKRINETTEAIFNFEVLDSVKSWHQNFFGYKITYRTIPAEEAPVENTTDNPVDNSTENKTDDPVENVTENKTDYPVENLTEKGILGASLHKNITFENTTPTEENEKIIESNVDENNTEKENQATSLSKHKTGYSTIFALLVILILSSILIIKFKRD